MASAYAAGTASSRTRTVAPMLAVAELISGGHGLAPVVAPKNSLYPDRVSGAVNLGGLVAASDSLWNEVSTIQNTGTKKMMPTSQATIPQTRLARRERLGVIAWTPHGTGTRRRAARRWR